MDTAAGSKASAEYSSLRTLACDTCRSRKIKCDKLVPCSGCKAAGIACKTTKKPPEKRQRILISNRYEKEVESVNNRLANLERILSEHVQNNTLGASKSQSPNTFVSQATSTPKDSQQTNHDMPFEGESSFTAQSMQASNALESALRQAPNLPQEIASALLTLKGALAGASSVLQTEATQSSSPQRLSDLTLPSMNVVLQLLRSVKTKWPTDMHKMFLEVPFLRLDSFTALCQKIYFPTEEHTLIEFMALNGGLYYLFHYLSKSAADQSRISQEDISNNKILCASNIQAAVHDLKLILEPSLLTIQAIALAALVIVDHATRPFLAWTLTSTAARLCQDIGFHRLNGKAGTEEQRVERMTFWFCYSMEQGMALNFGRTPVLQDHDISTPRPEGADFPVPGFTPMYNAWMEFCSLQGRIYADLYCSKALKEAPATRASRARELGKYLTEIKVNFDQHNHIFVSPGASDSNLEEVKDSVELIFYSAMTLIYRALPPVDSSHPLRCSDECVAFARTALLIHNESWKKLSAKDSNAWNLFAHENLLYHPFSAFTVLFGNIAATLNTEDLRILDEVITSMESAAQFSEGVAKLLKVCSIFRNVARWIVEQGRVEKGKRIATEATAQQPETTQMDMQGFVPNFSQQQWNDMLEDWNFGFGAGDARDMTNYLGDYFGVNSGFDASQFQLPNQNQLG